MKVASFEMHQTDTSLSVTASAQHIPDVRRYNHVITETTCISAGKLSLALGLVGRQLHIVVTQPDTRGNEVRQITPLNDARCQE
jgi:hypothetical protein